MARNIGRILCLNADGGVQFTVSYNVPSAVRDAELFTENGVYYQNAQDSQTGQWSYKYLRPIAGRPTDENLSEYRYGSDPNWDGPVPDKPMATWNQVVTGFQEYVNAEPQPRPELLDLFALTHAAFHKLPVPEPVTADAQVVDEIMIPVRATGVTPVVVVPDLPPSGLPSDPPADPKDLN